MSRPRRREQDYIATLPPPADSSGVVCGPSMPPGLRFLGRLGEGSSGRVVAAYSEATGSLVAVKLISPEYLSHAELRQRLFAEASAARRLSSEHVAKVYEYGEMADGTPYIVMEYLEGTTLEEHLTTYGPVRADVAVECIMQVSDALAEAHALGLIHRDVKPANVFLTTQSGRKPHVKVLDFGIVKDTISSRLYGRITKDKSVMGTPAYMAPEQLDMRGEADCRVDVWAVGVTLYQLLTGDVPFIGRSIPQILAAIAEAPMPSIRARRPDVSHRLERIVARCLSKSPEGRYSSAAELSLALGAELF